MVDIKPLTRRFIKNIPKESIVFDKKVRSFCILKYPNHKKGCINHNKKDGCPPNSPYLEDFIMKGDYIDFYLVYAEFDFKKYKQIRLNILKERHKDNPNRNKHIYSDSEIGNLLYWQKQMKTYLYNKIREINQKNPDFYLLSCGAGYSDKNNSELGKYSMESVGIHVFSTLENNSIDIERNPIDKIKLITLLCYKDYQYLESKEYIEDKKTNKKIPILISEQTTLSQYINII